MKKLKTKIFVSLAILLSFPSLVFADSPLTSTYFADTYFDYKIVKYADSVGVVDQKIANYLLGRNPIDVKAAVCNGMGWSTDGKSNAILLKKFIARKFRKDRFEDVKERKIKQDIWMVLGYLTALDNYFLPANGLKYFEKVKKKKYLNSYTFQVIYSLVKSQMAFDTDWCMVWSVYNTVKNNKDLKKDFREMANARIQNYLIIYEEFCSEE